MTDDNNARYRSSDPFARTPGPDGQGSDPLAELARLIGQSDPFSDIGRDPRVAAPREPQRYDDPAPQWHHPPAPSFDPFAAHQATAASPSADRGYADHGYKEPASQPRAFHPDFSIPAPQPHHAASYDAPSLEGGSRHGQAQSLLHFSSERPSPPPPMDELYDDAPQRGRRKGLLTVVAVLCLAVVGTAGAFGYRTWFGGPSVKAPPAVIRASVEPSKVAPPPSTDQSNKISYDRFGDRGQNEKVVVREERPIDLRDATRSGPAGAMVPSAPSQSSPAVASAAGNPPSVLTEPKRVRTVPIRPDAPDASVARPQMVQPPAASPSAPVRQTTVVAAAPSNAPLDLANPASPPPQARAAAPRPAPAPVPMAAAPSANVPLSLAPETSSPPSAAPVRAAPARVASAPAGNGSYLVQVASQRSEADAQAAYRSIQSKYSGVIGSRQPVIKRAELAGKGTYFRAMVGPFTTRDQAIQLCSSLKSAGGDCVVQAN